MSVLKQRLHKLVNSLFSVGGFLGIEVTAPVFKTEHVALLYVFGQSFSLENSRFAVFTFEHSLISLKPVYYKLFHHFAFLIDSLSVLTVKPLPSDTTITVLSLSVR